MKKNCKFENNAEKPLISMMIIIDHPHCLSDINDYDYDDDDDDDDDDDNSSSQLVTALTFQHLHPTTLLGIANGKKMFLQISNDSCRLSYEDACFQGLWSRKS